ncbi:MAG: HAD-IA family hydrolase [Desulfococcaceae bacterium]
MTHTRIDAVLFDFDGTLTRPGALDFGRMRRKLGCPDGQPVLEFIAEMAGDDDRDRAMEALAEFEREAAAESAPNAGAEAAMKFARDRGLRLGILTRNRRDAVERALENFPSFSPEDFAAIITREDPAAPKPSPEGVRLAAERMGVPPERVMVVGDFDFDVAAAHAAGAPAVFLTNGGSKAVPPDADHVVHSLSELPAVLRQYIPLPGGKFPNDLLGRFLDGAGRADPALLIHPRVGEDTAAVDISGEEVLVLKSDPITFATDAISQYAVLVNANDVVTAGAVPRWFLTTFMFPVGTTPAEVTATLAEKADVCRKWNITLCGGHTEITDAVNRPVVTGTLAGTVSRSKLIDKRNMKAGDRVLVTKGVSVEGTSIIAREMEGRLLEKGMEPAEIERCRNFLSRISVMEEARIAAGIEGVSALHDVTEGGIATALEELSIAGGHRLRIHAENIPMFPETRSVCEALEIHPLGLIGSGSLLICCREESTGDLIRAVFAAGVEITVIGHVMAPGEGIASSIYGEPAEWPKFEVDEIARLFGEGG